MKLEAKDIFCGYNDKSIVKGVSFTVEPGDVFCLLGPNGVGKTTLFKAVLGFIKLQKGQVLINGIDTAKMDRREIAKQIGYIPQAHTPPFPYEVLDVVLMGRSPHINKFSSPQKQDLLIAEECLERLGISHLKYRVYTEISGGERQLVLIARALAQKSKILVMDEPTSNLDYGNQARVLKHIEEISKDGIGIIMTTHCPNQVFLSATKVAIMTRDYNFITGDPQEILTEKMLRKLYNIETMVLSTKVKNRKDELKSCIPII